MSSAKDTESQSKFRRTAAPAKRPFQPLGQIHLARRAGKGLSPTARRDEPLSLAEELAEQGTLLDDDIDERYEQIKQSGDTHIAQLQKMSMAELIEEARKENLSDIAGMKRQDLIFRILKERVKMNGLMYGEGTLEILPDGFGFLRSPDYHYLSCPDDIYVSPSQIRRFGLKTGVTVSGQIRPPQGKRTLLRPLAGRGHQFIKTPTWPPPASPSTI